MLLIGDIAINKIDPTYPVNRIEIIARNKHEGFITNSLGLRSGKKINNVTTRYYKGTKEVLIHDANKSVGLNKLLLETASDSFKVKILPPRLQFAIQRISIVHLYLNPDKWSHDVKGYNILRHKVLDELNNRSAVTTELNKISTLLLDWKLSFPELIQKKQKFKHVIDNDLSLWSILRIVCDNQESPYNDLWDNNFYDVNDYYFEKLSFKDKLDACMDRLYVDTINDYIIGHPDQYKLKDMKLNVMFKRAYNTLCYDFNKHPLFTKFLINNYDNIMKYYSVNFYILYLSYIRKGR